MKDTGVQDLSPESCNKPSGDIFVFRYLFCRKKAWYTEQNNLEFVEKNPMEEKTYRTRCGTIHYWASVSNLNLFKFAATKGNLSAVDGIFQNGPNQCCAEKGRGTVLTGEFLKTVGLQIFGKPFAPVSVFTYCSKIVRMAGASSSLICSTQSTKR